MACTATAPQRCYKPTSTTTCCFSEERRHHQKRHKQGHHHHQQQQQQEEEEMGDQEQEQEQVIKEKQKEQPLLPGLPDDVAKLCLARLPPRLLFSLCRPWRRLLYAPSFPPFLSLYALLSSPSTPSVELRAFDPVAAAWRPLPAHPHLRHLLLRHPAFLSRSFPVQSVSAAGRLVLLAATATRSLLPALPRPLLFHPATSRWHLGPPLPAPRRWCAAGSAGGLVYVAGGVGAAYSADVSRSAERWDPTSPAGWEPVVPLRDGRFSREAVDLVASGGKLCVVNVKGKGAKEGAVYDLAGDRWEGMPPGMLAGWTGPAAAAEESPGSPPATIYVADEAEGVLRAYDWARDAWATVASSDRLRGAVHVAAGGGRVCVACAGGDHVVVIDVTSRPARQWAVEPPDGRRVLALHVLPRVSRPERHA